VEDRSARIAELCDKDLGKNLEILQTESKILDRLTSEKRGELLDLQKYAGSLYQLSDKGPSLHVLDEQTKELS
jgi:hypothetical protein